MEESSSLLDRIIDTITAPFERGTFTVVFVTGLGLYAYNVYKRKRLTPECAKEGKYEKDKVYVLSFPRTVTKNIPASSPSTLKLENWLRLHKIDYEYVLPPRMQKSEKRAMPYVCYNGKEYADTEFIIEFLARQKGVDLGYGLSPDLQGVSRAFQKLIEENMVWTYFLYRYVWHLDEYSKYFQMTSWSFFNTHMVRGLRRWMRHRAYMHGIGRHTEAEVAEIARKDLSALSNYLGKKPYMMGDQPTLVDCSLFGHLAQIVYQDLNYPHKVIMRDDCPNLLEYSDRMKNLLWPDWDDLSSPGQF